ncbi:MAG TPA: cation:proton antiporter [Blastocatellia bacterium]|nr:cation:proton antiporter [Blastocatellia bacterium]
MTHDLHLLEEILILLVTSLPIAFLCKRLKLPVIVGFIITGVVIGPYGLGLIKDSTAVELLAEIGVVLLLFTVGLELSLRRVLELKRLVLLGGGLQVLLTTALVTGVAYWLGRPVNQAIFFGFLLALSSTAIVLKSYVDRAEIDSPHGRAGVGILLFQDLCLVPMMLLAPILGGQQGSSAGGVVIILATAFGAIAAIVIAARVVVPRALHQIIRLRSPEVFVIFIVLVSLGTSWITAQFGLSLALGAFIAGLVLSESEYSHQIVADILPFRDVFNSIFFMSIGMLLSLNFLWNNPGTVLLLSVVVIVSKVLISLISVRLLGYSLRVSTMAALGIAQVGEFSFILAKVGLGHGLLSGDDYQRFLAIAIVSMIATPFLIAAAPRIGYGVQSLLSPDSALEPSMMGFAAKAQELVGHVIIVGYGLNGRNLSRVLGRVGISYVVVELNAELVRSASAEGVPVRYGDSTRREVLHAVNFERARILVLAISDPIAARRTVAIAREMNPHIHIIVRTRYMAELSDLYELGANQVIPEEFETSIEIFSRVLREFGIARQAINREIEEIRREGYQMLRLPSLSTVELGDIAGALGAASTETLVIGRGDFACGKTLNQLDLRRITGATVVAVIRDSQTEINPGGEFKLETDDIVVLLGSPEQIEMATETITREAT